MKKLIKSLKNNIILLLILLVVFFIIFFVKKEIFPYFSINGDEVVYVYQAKMYSNFKLRTDIPEPHDAFKQWFIVDDYNTHKRYGKYFWGAPLFYAIGFWLFGEKYYWLILPMIAVLNILLVYLLAREFFTKKWSLLYAFLVFFNPFFIIISSTFLSHSPDLTYILLFLLGFVKTLKYKKWYWAILMGIGLGLSFNTRPLTAVAFAIPSFFIGLYFLSKDFKQYIKLFLIGSVVFFVFLGLFFGYNKILTGDYLKTPFQAWCKDDKYGFGMRRMDCSNSSDFINYNLSILKKSELIRLSKGLDIIFGGYIFFLVLLNFYFLLSKKFNKSYRFLGIFSLIYIFIVLFLYAFHYGFNSFKGDNVFLNSFGYPYVYQGIFLFFIFVLILLKKIIIKKKIVFLLFSLYFLFQCWNIFFYLKLHIKYNAIQYNYYKKFFELKNNKKDRFVIIVPKVWFYLGNPFFLYTNSWDIPHQKFVFIQDLGTRNKNCEVVKKFSDRKTYLFKFDGIFSPAFVEKQTSYNYRLIPYNCRDYE